MIQFSPNKDKEYKSILNDINETCIGSELLDILYIFL